MGHELLSQLQHLCVEFCVRVLPLRDVALQLTVFLLELGYFCKKFLLVFIWPFLGSLQQLEFVEGLRADGGVGGVGLERQDLTLLG